VVVAAGTLAAPVALGAIRITKIYYNSPGGDNRSNASLNAEWIRLKNTGHSARQLRGWTISDAFGDVYRFGRFRLNAGSTVTIHTGRGRNTRTDRYWGRRNYEWNNKGDTARLRRANGALADSCSYKGGHASPVVC
jgi:hypothetical protein